MKLRRPQNSPRPDYPTFAAFHGDRDHYLGPLARGTGMLLLAGMLSGCDASNADPDKPLPDGLVPPPVERLRGEIAAPEPPKEVECVPLAPRVEVGGIMAVPADPKEGAANPAEVDPPPEAEPPRLQGKPAMPQPPKIAKPVELEGDVAYPEPPRLQGTTPPPPPPEKTAATGADGAENAEE